MIKKILKLVLVVPVIAFMFVGLVSTSFGSYSTNGFEDIWPPALGE